MGEHYAEDVGVESSILSFLINLFILKKYSYIMKIRSLEDIEREKHDDKRDKLTDDINKVIEGVFKKPKKEESIFWIIGKILGGLVLLIIAVNIILGNIWLLKFFWSEFF